MTLVIVSLEVIVEKDISSISAQMLSVKQVIAKLDIQNVVSIRKNANFFNKGFVHISMIL